MQALLASILDPSAGGTRRSVAGRIRHRFHHDPEGTLVALARWTEHPEAAARTVAGLALGAVTIRRPDALDAVLPYLLRLAGDPDPEVRSRGAEDGLLLCWLHHYDETWLFVEEWFGRRNDHVREVIVRTMARIVRERRLHRPRTLHRFLRRGLGLLDDLRREGRPALLPALAGALNDFGTTAPELVSPLLGSWLESSEPATIALARELLDLPFGQSRSGIAREAIRTRYEQAQGDVLNRYFGLLRKEGTRISCQRIVGTKLLAPLDDGTSHAADPYRGCELECEFCAERSLEEYAEEDGVLVRRIVVVGNAAEILARELRNLGRPTVVRVGRTADPYQPAEERFRVTREVLKVLFALGVPTRVRTRGTLVLRDVELLAKMAERKLVEVEVALPTPLEAFRRRIEPDAPSVPERLDAIRRLAEAGVPVRLVVDPVLPFLNDDPEALAELRDRAAAAGAGFAVGGVLTLTGSARAKVRRFLEAEIPDLIRRYEEVYGPGLVSPTPSPEWMERYRRLSR